VQKIDVHLKISEMGDPLAPLDPIYYEYPSVETSGRLYADLLKGSLNYIFDLASYRGVKVLDIGCGYGWLSEAFVKKGAVAYGADINRGLCRFTQERSKNKKLSIMVVCCDGEHLPFKDRAFDVVTFNSSLHHLPNPNNGLSEGLRTTTNLYIINEPASIPRINRLISALSYRFRKEKHFTKGQNYDSIMDKEENETRFSSLALEEYCIKKGCSVKVRGYWCYVPPMLQQVNNIIAVILWKGTIKVLNTIVPNFGHTFVLKAANCKVKRST
jgi:SAM-dependent methyltransferase